MSDPLIPSAEFVSVQRSGQAQRVAQRIVGAHPATLVAGYRRHVEFDAGDHVGQDWCGARVVGANCVIVVADGVSQSFMGDIAARVLGRGLLDGISREGEAALLDPRCSGLLDELRASANREVETFALSDAIPEFLRGALEAKRASSGTQTVVAAALVNLATGRGRVLLVGDVSVTLHRRSGAPLTIVGDRRARWSNLHGLRGAIVNEAIEDLRAIVLATDGLSPDFSRDLAALTDDARVERAIASGAERDDASFVAVLTDVTASGAHDAPPERLPIPATVEGEPPRTPYFSPPAPPASPPGHVAQAYTPPAPQPQPTPVQGPSTSGGGVRRLRVILGVVLLLAGVALTASEILLASSTDSSNKVQHKAPVRQRSQPPAATRAPSRSTHASPDVTIVDATAVTVRDAPSEASDGARPRGPHHHQGLKTPR